MPSHAYHRRKAPLFGLPEKTARAIDRELDFPPGMAHKSLHNPLGVAYISARYGPNGGLYAAQHILDDLRAEMLKKTLKELFP